MKLFTEGTIAIAGPDNFEGTNGETVSYYKNYLKNSDGEIVEVGSKVDFQDCVGQYGVCELTIRKRDKGGYSLSLTKFTAGEAVEPIGTVE